MKIKEKYRLLLTLSLVILVSLTALQSQAGDRPDNAPPLEHFLAAQQAEGVEKEAPAVDPLSPLAGERVWAGDPAPLKIPPLRAPQQGAGCQQLIINPQLDVVELGDGTGTAEPWVVLWSRVYYDDMEYVSPTYSLVIVIGDADDPTPAKDGFGQAIYMPYGLTSITVEYERKIDFANSIDEVRGEFWSVDNQGFLDELIEGWIVGDMPSGWSSRIYTINDPSILSQMDGQLMALAMTNYTTDTSPGEVTWFDDITVTACFDPPDFASYMPFMGRAVVNTGPVCIPPSESPPDSWYNNRGVTQTGANCNSGLSQLDDRDYYSYVPSQSGSHTVHLRNLPSGSNWAALVYNDTEPPPGGPTNGGNCYTSQPGDGDKSVVCNFTAGQQYVIKVSSGETPMTGGYNLQVTRP